MHDPRGSNWRKWDLHIHTPASYQWSGQTYRSITDEVQRDKLTRDVIDAINASEVAVFGIMDYWTFDGYLEIKRYLRRHSDVKCTKTILPGIELRVESPTDYRMNVHVLLSDALTEQQLIDFRACLKLRELKRNLSNEAIIAAAKKLGASKAKVHGFADPYGLSEDKLYELGCKTIEITRDSFHDAINTVTRQACLVVMPYGTYNGLEKLDWQKHPFSDRDFMHLADIFETRDADDVSLFLGIRTERNKRFIDEFQDNMGGKPKPAVSGSDAHCVADYGNFPSKKATWIKADPTFNGLKQVLVEPKCRSFIGDVPPDIERVNSNRTKYLRSIRITKAVDSSVFGEAWFDNEVCFNHGLIAVIGNKGNGKSALVDIIALLCEYHRKEFLSFLNEARFRHPKVNKAQYYTAEIAWENDTIARRYLNDVAVNDGNKIRYIPQQFFEQICNETEVRRESEFDKELKKVIFSHVQEADRLGYNSLDALIEFRTVEIEQSIANLRANLSLLNKHIANLEIQLLPSYAQELQRSLEAKQLELDAHENSKPKEIAPPVIETDTAVQISSLRERSANLAEQAQIINVEKEDLSKKIVVFEKTEHLVDAFKSQYEKFVKDASVHMATLGLDLSRLVQMAVDKDYILSSKVSVSARLDMIQKNIGAIKEEIEGVEKSILALQSEMETADKEYQQYLTALEKWEGERDAILGDPSKQGSIRYFEQRLEDIKTTLPLQLEESREQRTQLSRDIYSQITKLATVYRELYAPVQHFIDDHDLIKDKYKLKFDVSITLVSDFVPRFLQKIRQNVSGPFRGREEGEQLLRDIVACHEFNDVEGSLDFVTAIISSFGDNKNAGRKSNLLKDQLKNTSVEEFYDFLFGLSYLEPDYALVLDNKKLPQLSPGERGILLLIFYLLVDGYDGPLVIDQPEENLDNQSIYELLVPCIEEAKQRRQIILVTHNANLAVVCDADQIIHAQIDKGSGNKVTYKSGSIENPEINGLLVDILEGTWPAFTKRQSMYQHRLTEYRRLFFVD
ncbi:MAG: hypothetical protein HGA45_07650 [Chloroflexales bacterium]|nr:hypothetical protein [Chloroflexales bacterium]